MDNATNPSQPKIKLFTSTLHLLASIYALLYLIVVVAGFFPLTIGLVSESENPYDLENLVVKLLFLLFLLGYFMSWKHEAIAGLIFILWWIAVWFEGKFIVMPLHGHGIEGIGMGFPVLLLAILFIVSWFKKKRESRVDAPK